MDSIVFGLLLLVGFFTGWGLGIAGYVRAGRLRDRMARLEALLAERGIALPDPLPAPRPASPWERPGADAGGPMPAPDPAAMPDPAARPAIPVAEPAAGAPAWAMAAAPEGMAGPAAAAAPGDPPPPGPIPDPASPGPARPALEEMLAQRWGVWLGAGAILLAGVFLVRTAVEEGWLGPGPRCGLAGLLGLLLVGAALWLRRVPTRERPTLPWPDQAPAALAAGGVAVLFGAAYATGPLYGLVPPLLGFALLAVAALAGIALALVFGPVVAAIGIAGAYATPALVQSDAPFLPGLFAYLLAVTAAALVVLRQVGAAWLGWAAMAAAAGWTLLGATLSEGGDLWAPALFAPAAAALHLALLPRGALAHPVGKRLAWLPFALLAAALLAGVPWMQGLALASGLLLFSPVALVAAARQKRLAALPWLAALAGLLLLLAWPLPAWQPAEEAVTAGGLVQAILPIHPWPPEALLPFLSVAALLAAMHALAGAWQERRARRPLAWASLPAALPVLVLLVAYARVRGFALDGGWAMAALALAAALTGLAGLAAREGAPKRAGAHAAGAVAALALGAAMLLTDQWLTLAIALLLPPLAWIEGRSGLDALRLVARAVAAVVLARLLLNGEVLGYAFGTAPLLNLLLVAYGGPAAGFALAAALFARRRDDATVALLEGGALAFLAALVVLLIRHAVTGGDIAGEPPRPFLEAGLQVTALSLLAAATRLLDWRLGGRPVLRVGWQALQVVAVLGGLALVALNPAFTDGADLAMTPLLNELALAYALPGLLAALMLRGLRGRVLPRALAFYALLAGFTWVTLTVRHQFHPLNVALDAADVTAAELYAYSGAWLLLGAALLALGIRLGLPALRLAALGAIGLTILKAFLVDMDELDGLWRVLSFLGLGLSLIALGWVYRRFVVVAPVRATAT